MTTSKQVASPDTIRELDASELDAVSGGTDLATKIFTAGIIILDTLAPLSGNHDIQVSCPVAESHGRNC